MLTSSVSTVPPDRSRVHITPGRRASRWAVALLTLASLLALGACGASHTTIVHTTTVRNAGTLYFNTSSVSTPPFSATLNALSAGDGKPRWNSQLAGAAAPLAFNGTTLFVDTVQYTPPAPPSGSTLAAFTAASGAKTWSHDFTGQVPFPIAASADTLFVSLRTISAPSGGPSTDTVAALHASDGTIAWSANVAGQLAGAAVFGDGALYVVTITPGTMTATTPPEFTLTALSASDGKPLWHLKLDGSPIGQSGPVLTGGVLYLAEESAPAQGSAPPASIILAIKVSDGTRVWQTTSVAESAVMDLLAGTDGIYYTYSNMFGPGGGLVALRASDGTVAWQQTTANTAPTLLGADGGVIYTLDVNTGKTVANPAIAVRAYEAHSGTVKFEKPFPTLPVQFLPKGAAPGIIVGDTLYLLVAGVPAATAAPAKQQTQSVALALRTSDGTLQWSRVLDGDPGRPLFYTAP